jgi:4-amino-4-deoxy-L-arabinose transferase-like glycosyltransferase
MKPKLTHQNLLFIFVLVITAAYLAGLPAVPFHPDESTQIFMSSDLELFFSQPSEVYWQPDKSSDLRQRYRELDAPLTRYLIGIGRQVLGESALPADWNWTRSWEDNRIAGAYPDPKVLAAARWPQALLFPLSLLLLFYTVKAIAPVHTAWLAMLLFAGNALVLLHTRRAMAESVLLFTIILTLWSVVQFKRSLWWAAVPAALAFCAKQSTGILILPVLATILWQHALPLKHRLLQIVLALGLFGGVIFILNPFLWSNPLQASRSALVQRSHLVDQQVAMMAYVNPEKVLNSFPSRLAAQVAQLYFLEPAVKDVANYADELRTSELAYLSNPLHRLMRSFLAGILLMLLSLFGFFSAGLQAWKLNSKRHSLALLLLAHILQMLVLFWFIPLPIQRYSLPLVPFVCIWSAFGISKLGEMAVSLYNLRPTSSALH